jgi:hypothetical protein
MRSLLRPLTSVAAIALSAGVVLAGTPLPDPPFSSGGFVAPDSLVYKQELSVGKVLTKYSVGLAKCDMKAVIALQLAYEPANLAKVPDVQQAWVDCRAKNDLKYTTGRDKLLLKGTPACLDQAGIDAFRAVIDAQFPLLAPFIYCDGDAAAPDPVTNINIPDFKIEASGEVSAAKVVLKVGTSAAKCLTKAFGIAFKLGGTIPPEYLAKIDACLAKYETYGMDAMAKLDQTQKLPACLTLATAQTLVSSTVDLAGQFSDENYCASPSGAFLD